MPGYRRYPIIPYSRFTEWKNIRYAWGMDAELYGTCLLEETVMHKTYKHKKEPARGSTCPGELATCQDMIRPPTVTLV